MKDDFSPLTGQFLIASPGMDDLRFDKAVIYIYQHTPDTGAQGIVINKPAEKISLRDILNQLKFPKPDSVLPPVLLGGPDKITSGFILHSSDYRILSTNVISDDVFLTATQDILYDISAGKGPQEYLVALGQASWQAGQLEDEIMGNLWLTCPATHQILFHTPFSEKWSDSLKTLGIDVYRFCNTAGKA